MTQIIKFGFFSTLLAYSLLVPSAAQETLGKPPLTAIVSCLREKASETGSPLLISDAGKVRVRYHSGKYSFRYPTGESVVVGRDNEVRVGVYDRDDHAAVIYDVFLARSTTAFKIEIASPSTFHKRSGEWVSGDNPGGVATELYMKSLLQTFSKEEPTILTLNGNGNVNSEISCVVLHPYDLMFMRALGPTDERSNASQRRAWKATNRSAKCYRPSWTEGFRLGHLC